MAVWALAWLALAVSGAAPAQEPPIAEELLDRRIRLDGNRIVFCHYEKDATAAFDRSVASELARTLLLEPVFHDIDVPVEAEITDRLPIELDDLFILMTNHCDAIAGRTLVPKAWPDWLIFTRPYYYSPFVLVVTDPDYETLTDIPTSAAIGTRLGSYADGRLLAYLQSLPADGRWKRISYLLDTDLLQRLADGTLAGALIWEPSLLELTNDQPELHGLRVISTHPLPALEFPVAVALRQRDVYLRTLFDDAIAALIEDGVLEELLAQHGTPGRPAAAHGG